MHPMQRQRCLLMALPSTPASQGLGKTIQTAVFLQVGPPAFAAVRCAVACELSVWACRCALLG